MAAPEKGRWVRGRHGAHGALPAIGPLGPDGGGAARRPATSRHAACAPRRAAGAARRDRAPRGARDAGDARRRAAHGSRVALRDQVRRCPRPRLPRRRPRRAPRAERPDRHHPLSRGDGGSARAAAHAVPAGRRDRRARRRRALELSAPPGTHGAHAPRRRRARAGGGAGQRHRLRRPRARRPRPARAPARGPQGMLEASGAGPRRRCLRRPRRRPRRRVPRGRLRAAPGGRDRQARQRVRRQALEGLAQDQVPARAGIRRRRLHGAPGTRAHFGALHLGLYEGGELVYVSKVGTGFDDKTLRLVSEKLRPLARATSPFARGTPAGRGHHWVEPRLVCQVRFTEWTRDGGIRHPAFLGLRDDKRPEDCVREVAVEAREHGWARRGRGVSRDHAARVRCPGVAGLHPGTRGPTPVQGNGSRRHPPTPPRPPVPPAVAVGIAPAFRGARGPRPRTPRRRNRVRPSRGG